MTRTVSAEATIDMPRSQAWEKLSDISLAHNYVPGIIKTVIVSDRKNGEGASRYVYRNGRSYIQETVVAWDEGHGFLLRLHRGEEPAPPFRAASFRYQLADMGQHSTLFTASFEFELPWGKLGRWLEKRMEKIVQATIAVVATAFKLYYETGQPTTSAALKAYKAAVGSHGAARS